MEAPVMTALEDTLRHWTILRIICDLVLNINPVQIFEASSLNQIKMTKNCLEYDQKILTTMNLIFLIWPKNVHNDKPYF